MNGKEMKEHLTSGKRVYGTAIMSTSPKWPEQIAKLDVDFVFIDTEHLSIDREQLSWMCNTYKSLDMSPIVRIPSPDPFEASKVLDGGADGVIAPYIETVEQVKELRGAVKLRPLKGEVLQDVIKENKSLSKNLKSYIDKGNDDKFLILNIESAPAIEGLDDMLEVPGVDAVLIGPHDLSTNLGIPEQYRDPKFEEAVETIFQKARAQNVGAGIHYWQGMDQQIKWIKEDGLNLIVHSSDLNAAVKNLGKELSEIKNSVGDKSSSSSDNSVVI